MLVSKNALLVIVVVVVVVVAGLAGPATASFSGQPGGLTRTPSGQKGVEMAQDREAERQRWIQQQPQIDASQIQLTEDMRTASQSSLGRRGYDVKPEHFPPEVQRLMKESDELLEENKIDQLTELYKGGDERNQDRLKKWNSEHSERMKKKQEGSGNISRSQSLTGSLSGSAQRIPRNVGESGSSTTENKAPTQNLSLTQSSTERVPRDQITQGQPMIRQSSGYPSTTPNTSGSPVERTNSAQLRQKQSETWNQLMDKGTRAQETRLVKSSSGKSNPSRDPSQTEAQPPVITVSTPQRIPSAQRQLTQSGQSLPSPSNQGLSTNQGSLSNQGPPSNQGSSSGSAYQRPSGGSGSSTNQGGLEFPMHF
jgi:hypothetical protein